MLLFVVLCGSQTKILPITNHTLVIQTETSQFTHWDIPAHAKHTFQFRTHANFYFTAEMKINEVTYTRIPVHFSKHNQVSSSQRDSRICCCDGQYCGHILILKLELVTKEFTCVRVSVAINSYEPVWDKLKINYFTL